MFRFTIRELLLIMLVIGVGLGWAIRERQLSKLAAQWKTAAHILENSMEATGWTVTLRDDGLFVRQPGVPAGTDYFFDGRIELVGQSRKS